MSADDMDYSGAQERAHFQRIVHAFRSYKSRALKHVKEREEYIHTLPNRHQQLLNSYKNHLKKQKVCIQHNGEIIDQIINGVESMFENVQHEPLDAAQDPSTLDMDIEKVKSTIRQIVRDWSPLGERERSLCYSPVIDQIVRLFPPNQLDTSSINILVPGAGLGRLAHEIARRGYSCQGNEFSLFMLMASNFILNKCRGPNSLRVYPWVHTGSNQLSNNNQLQEATFPDQDPSELPPESQFTIAAGDFLEIYTEQDSWDCIATSFFIDCASNIVSFIETIFKIIKPGGYWVNLGPLLYHFEEQPEEPSIELSYEEVKNIIKGIGFKIIVEKKNVETTYTQNVNSMMQYGYRSIFFVAKKP